ncbi:glutathione synthase/RimK-type ligase-like ATP-grasp enzyme [Paenibacillus forsythiae]|uniref:Glutathione synthase/RimK-type ligase-like ATP-grasp enzyme n=1 Tax=Paenibacillus forsythiae TaxID=365616 RepID=A0ABU3HC05_9BACL|nr:YheC/YheD family protein [Paenibacillus forsythiae]MDT3427215.1 glutathione synthase/RimK-type ligase-like ATP-grasp enzyme [Paenibacillus forsythiae]
MKVKSTLTSKWIKTKVLLRSPEISALIPETARLTRENAKRMLDKYGMVYIKPEVGTYGNGVIRAERRFGKGGAAYWYQSGTRQRTFNAFEAFYSSLKGLTRSRKYLIQKGIDLLKAGGRRFDIRVMVQRGPGGVWETTGLIGRVAGKGKVVTNYHAGGKPTAVEKLLAPHMNDALQAETLKRLRKLGKDIGNFYKKNYLGFKQLGVDIGLDRALTPWIIEVNTNPDPYIFNQLKDKTMYRKVMAYRRAQQSPPSRK